MTRVLLFLALAGILGLWGWALYWPKPAAPLVERYRGTFLIYRFEPPVGVTMASPVPLGQKHRYTFRGDGTYVYSVGVSGGYEMARREGTLSVDDQGILTLVQVSVNRRENREEPLRYRTRWGQDDGGNFLELQHLEDGYSFFLRPEP